MSMTIKELIKELQKYPPETQVQTEGCDCYGDANGVEYVENEEGRNQNGAWIKYENYVLITRSN